MSNAYNRHPASYRDPAGFIFYRDGQLYRQVNQQFQPDFDLFTGSGAYEQFVKEGWLLAHQREENNYTGDPDWYTTLKPARIPFITYPWEWCFSMLKDAALLTLRLARVALDYNLSLKDATPLNVQWYQGAPVFIDTLSFEKYQPTRPWIAYRQFCETFLSPLLLMHYSKQPLQPLMLAYPDGIPLRVTGRLLPWKTRLNLPVYLHIHLHSKLSAGAHRSATSNAPTSFSKQKMINLL
ncbi:MAG: SAM-dependent methyltransferase, partial [Chitinophagaceae bacterium]